MNKDIEPKEGSWILLVSPAEMNTMMLTVIARLAQGGPVKVIDCGNRFQAYGVARAAGRMEPSATRVAKAAEGGLSPTLGLGDAPRTPPRLGSVLKRISVARAFTCHQVLSLLEKTPAMQEPFVVLDLLRAFYDESVRAGDRKRLLQGCIGQLNRLQRKAGGVVSVHPPAAASQTAVDLLEILELSAADVYFTQPVEPVIEQMSLF